MEKRNRENIISWSFEERIPATQDLHFYYLNKICKTKGLELDYKALHLVNSEGDYTNLALLLSSECPYSVKVTSFFGVNVDSLKDKEEFTGSILEQYDIALKYIDLYNQTKGVIRGLERVDTPSYSTPAIKEALINAIAHQDYSLGGNIFIYIFDDHMEITSLGSITSNLTLSDVTSGVSKSRNINLVNLLISLGYMKGVGCGLRLINEEYNLKKYKAKISATQTTFKVSLPNCNYKGIKFNERDSDFKAKKEEDIVMSLFTKGNEITRKDIENSLGVSKSKAYSIVSSLISKGVIRQVGNDKNTFYTLVD